MRVNRHSAGYSVSQILANGVAYILQGLALTLLFLVSSCVPGTYGWTDLKSGFRGGALLITDPTEIWMPMATFMFPAIILLGIACKVQGSWRWGGIAGLAIVVANVYQYMLILVVTFLFVLPKIAATAKLLALASPVPKPIAEPADTDSWGDTARPYARAGLQSIKDKRMWLEWGPLAAMYAKAAILPLYISLYSVYDSQFGDTPLWVNLFLTFIIISVALRCYFYLYDKGAAWRLAAWLTGVMAVFNLFQDAIPILEYLQVEALRYNY